MKETLTDDDEFTTEASFSFDFGSEIQILNLKSSFDPSIPTQGSKTIPAPARFQGRIKDGKLMKRPLAGSDKDIAAFKRDVWQEPDE